MNPRPTRIKILGVLPSEWPREEAKETNRSIFRTHPSRSIPIPSIPPCHSSNLSHACNPLLQATSVRYQSFLSPDCSSESPSHRRLVPGRGLGTDTRQTRAGTNARLLKGDNISAGRVFPSTVVPGFRPRVCCSTHRRERLPGGACAALRCTALTLFLLVPGSFLAASRLLRSHSHRGPLPPGPPQISLPTLTPHGRQVPG